jgi:hypothetical protein
MADTDAGPTVVRRAERIVFRAKLQIMEERALATAAGTAGPAYVRLYPPSSVIYLVTFDGRLLGRARLTQPDAGLYRWMAVPRGGRPLTGRYPDLPSAACALAGTAGICRGVARLVGRSADPPVAGRPTTAIQSWRRIFGHLPRRTERDR